jgi:hypothetical protein
VVIGAAPQHDSASTGDHHRYRPPRCVLWHRSLDNVLCLPPDTSEPDSRRHWARGQDLLRLPHSLAEFAAELAPRHRTEAEVVADDVRPVPEELAALGLIEPVF